MGGRKLILGVGCAAAAAILGACSVNSPVRAVDDVAMAAAAPVASSSAAPTTSAAPAGLRCTAEADACVDLTTRQAWLVRDGQVTYGPVSIMPGDPNGPGTTTPTGTFHVLLKQKMHYSHEFHGEHMPNSVFFAPGIAFHAGSLQDYSHGCVHLSTMDSQEFFTDLNVGDEVQIVG